MSHIRKRGKSVQEQTRRYCLPLHERAIRPCMALYISAAVQAHLCKAG